MSELRYPIGMQDFARLRQTGMVYVDKTRYVYRLANEGGETCFLSRPRRFGKSLLVSTLKCYFEGRRDLFAGLAIDSLEKEWNHHEVILLDMSLGRVNTLEELHAMLDYTLRNLETKYTLPQQPGGSYSTRLSAVISAAAAMSHEGRAVVLVDEYDAPILDSLNDEKRLREVRNIMRGFYSPLKSMAASLRFLFLTGVTKFSQMSIFSELNNLNNISMIPGWDAICGITTDEMHQYMEQSIADLAKHLQCTPHEMMERLKALYDGYHFTEALVDIYNPFSLMKVFGNKVLKNYWFESGSPTWLFELMAKSDFEFNNLDGIEAFQTRFDRATERISDVVPVLFQSGYLTITGYDRRRDIYTLGIPNKEVRDGLATALIDYVQPSQQSNQWLLNGYFQWHDGKGSLEEFMRLLKDFYLSIPYDITNDNERHYQAILYAVLTSFGADVTCEDRTANGRADLVLRMPDEIYVIELKYGKSVGEAMEQLHLKDYAAKYRHENRPVRLLAINLDAKTRTIESWQVE